MGLIIMQRVPSLRVKRIENISREKLAKYFTITRRAIEKAIKSKSKFNNEIRDDFLDMIQRYYEDAIYFEGKNDFVNAFAALNYAHGWLDAGARIGIFIVNDRKLFAA